jgi:hypothetical protein
MSSEAELVISIWEAIREVIPHTKRLDLSTRLLYAFAEYGFDAADLESIVDEDPDLTEAYQEVFLDEEDAEESTDEQ